MGQARGLVENEPVDLGYRVVRSFGVREGTDPETIEYPRLGYADAAKASYAVFTRLRDEGVLADGVRFQVSLPTVVAGTVPFLAPDNLLAVEPAYARRLRAEVDEILAAIPAGDLALQWDVAVEIGVIEGVFPAPFPDAFDNMIERLAALSAWVPVDVKFGYHLCYGDAQEETGVGEGRHFIQPKHAGNLVAVANAVGAAATRRVDWLSMPVPIDRDDAGYYEPLSDLRLTDGTRFYLGLVHHQDGVEGTQRRIDVAKRYIERFGVATECGMGRKPTELVRELLRIQRDVRV